VIVRWSLRELPALLDQLEISSPFLIASDRRRGYVDVPVTGVWPEVPSDRVRVASGSDALLAVGGGSAIDTAKAVSSETGLRVVSVPTTYSGAEWTTSFGIRRADRTMAGGGGGAHLAGIVYEVGLTLGLPLAETVGTALNALAHCAEALYGARTEESDTLALEGARLIAEWLPRVVEAPQDLAARDGLLHGAAAAGEALGIAGLALAHAMAQALGGTYGLSHGAMNALTLAPALRYNAAYVPDAIARFGAAVGAEDDPASKVEELARLAGFEHLGAYGIPEEELRTVAELAAGRAGNRRNPHPATSTEIETMLRSIY
jgi:maleylacetate reductase